MYPGRDRRFSSAATKLCWNASWNVWMLRAGWRKYIGSRRVAGLDFVVRSADGSRPCGGCPSPTDPASRPHPTGPLRGRVTFPSEWGRELQVVPADGAQVVEDPDAEGNDRGDRQVDAQLVAEIGQASGQRHVGDQPAEEHARLERAGDVCLQRAEDRVERRQQGDRRVAGVGDRDRDRREQPQNHAEDRKGDRDDDYLHGLGGAGVAGAAGGLGFAPTAGSTGFIALRYGMDWGS